MLHRFVVKMVCVGFVSLAGVVAMQLEGDSDHHTVTQTLAAAKTHEEKERIRKEEDDNKDFDWMQRTDLMGISSMSSLERRLTHGNDYEHLGSMTSVERKFAFDKWNKK